MPSNQRIGRIETGTCGVHQHVNRQIGQRQFARRERIAAVYGEESHAHRENHRDESQPVEQPRDKPGRTDDFAEDRQRERNTAADTQRIGKRGGKRIEVLPLGDAVRHQQSSENNAGREQQPRIAGGIRFVRKQKSQYCIHNLGNLCSNITINAGISNTPPHNFGHPQCDMPRTAQRQREHAPIFRIFTAAIYNIAMIQQTEFTLRPRTRGFHLVTDEIAANLPPLPDAGLVHLFIKHTSAGLSINENADPDVRTDLSAIFDRLVRERESYYVHTLEGDDDMPAHAKSTLTGAELTIPVTQGRLNLGTWQGIYLCEFRNRASGRRIVATLIG